MLGVGSTLDTSGPTTTSGIFLARFLADGSPDPAFAGGGSETVYLPGNLDFVEDAVVLADGRILVDVIHGAPAGNHDFALARFDSHGSLDTSFGDQGLRLVDLGSDDFAYGMALQGDGKVVIAGQIRWSPPSMVVVRVDAAGILDTSFGNEGKTIVGDLSHTTYAGTPLVLPDGRIFVTSARYPTSDPSRTEGILVGLNSAGNFRRGFGSFGIVTETAPSAGVYFGRPHLLPHGQILVTARVGNNPILIRYAASTGALDTTYGSGGRMSTGSMLVYDETVVAGGKVLVAGYDQATGHTVIRRYLNA